MTHRKRAGVVLVLLGVANLLIWGIALAMFRRFGLLLGTASLAYTFGLRHALDADHISAIDNVTRKLVQDGKRPLLVGLFFSLGHSTIVILLSGLIALGAARIQGRFPAMKQVGGLIGTSVSAVFLLGIAGVNLLILCGIVRAFRSLKRGETFSQQGVDQGLFQLGFLGRVLRPVVRLADRSWKMYFVGLLFGLGFDTATEVGLLGMSAAAATQGLAVWSILIFPLLFTAGMCLVDTIDGILMVGAYRWAQVHPVRKLYYNMTITAVSVLIAAVIGGVEALNIVAEQFDLHGWFWNGVTNIGKHFGLIGCAIVGVFALSWIFSVICYRVLGYDRLELAHES